MRKLLLLTAISLASFTSMARAEVPVIDAQSNLQQLKQYALDIKKWILEQEAVLHEYNTDIQTAKIYLQDVETYISWVANPAYGAQQLLNQTGLTDDLPVSPTSMMQIASGFTSINSGGGFSLSAINSKLGMLSNLSSGAYAENHVYTCTSADAACKDVNARANGIAGSMGTVQSVYADIQARQAIMTQLRADLNGTTTPALRETLMNQWNAENVYVNALAVKLQAAMGQATLQQNAYDQRVIERQVQGADTMMANNPAITDAQMAAPGVATAVQTIPTFSTL